VRKAYEHAQEDGADAIGRQLTSLARVMLGDAIDVAAAASGAPPSGQDLLARADRVEDAREHMRLIDKAIQVDPNLARAWTDRALLGMGSYFDGFNDALSADREQVVAKAEGDSSRAVTLDPADSRAWMARGRSLAFRGNVDGARVAFDRARELDPARFAPLTFLSMLALQAGDPVDSLRRLDEVRRASGSTGLFLEFLACAAHVGQGAYDAAIRECERAEAGYDNWAVFANPAAAYVFAGDAAKAARAKEKLLQAVPSFTIGRYEARGFNPTAAGIAMDRAHLVAGLRKAGVPE